MALPKKHIENMRLRNQEIGNFRRKLNVTRILDKSATFPKGVMLKDIDEAFYEWVEKDLYIVFDGEKIPTFKSFSNQRISEYAQNWQHTDSLGNVLMNIKLISRENDPKKGENQGSVFNVPGDRDYVMGYKLVLQENGQEAYDVYTMKQPFSIDLMYTVTIITNKYSLINEMNELVQKKFSALQVYLFPNGHSMPMKLDNVSDESEYSIDDRKYYAQSYKIKLMAYLVDPEGFKITHLPSRMRIISGIMGTKYKNNVKVKIEEQNECIEEAPSPYENQNVNIIIDYPSCHREVDFTIDMDLIVNELELTNIYDFVFYINEELQDFENNEIHLYNGDKIHIEIERDDSYNNSLMIVRCKNPHVIYDTRFDPESSLDETNVDLDIEIENGESE